MLYYPVNYYPIFENALRHHLGRDMPTHMQKLGELMQPFTEVAAQNPIAGFRLRARPGNRHGQ